MVTANQKKAQDDAKKKALKEKAVKLYAKGKFEKALESYLQLWKMSQGSKDELRIKMKVGEVLQKLKRTKEAIAVYKKIAQAYAEDGFLIQAISVCKIILELDSTEIETKNLLSNLYSKRGMEKDSRLISGKPMPEETPQAPAATTDAAPEVVEIEQSADELLDEFFSDETEVESREMPSIPLFSELERNEFLALIDSLTPWRVPGDTVICKEGETADSMFIIAYGQIRVSIEGEGGLVKELALLQSGDFFGEIGLFTQSVRTASCAAVEETELLEIKRSDFDDITARFPRVKEVLHEFYKSRVLDTILAKSPLFSSMTKDIRQMLITRFSAKEYNEGDFIIQEGEEGNSLFLIRDGSVEVLTDRSGHAVPLATLKAGDFFGEVALISDQKRTASVKALTPSVCMCLTRADFQWAAENQPDILNIVKTYVEKRVQDTIKSVS